jgi:Tol biopolymer transport system component
MSMEMRIGIACTMLFLVAPACAQSAEPALAQVLEGDFHSPSFLPDGELVVARSNQDGWWREDGRRHATVAAADSSAAAVAFAHRDRIYARTPRGLVRVGDGDRFFAPQASPDRSRVVFVGLATGLYVYDIAAAELTHLGPGTAPAWAPDSRRLVFELTVDDGQEIVASELRHWRAGDSPQPLALPRRLIARRPAWSPDGHSIAFDDDRGSVYLLALEGQR